MVLAASGIRPGVIQQLRLPLVSVRPVACERPSATEPLPPQRGGSSLSPSPLQTHAAASCQGPCTTAEACKVFWTREAFIPILHVHALHSKSFSGRHAVCDSVQGPAPALKKTDTDRQEMVQRKWWSPWSVQARERNRVQVRERKETAKPWPLVHQQQHARECSSPDWEPPGHRGRGWPPGH